MREDDVQSSEGAESVGASGDDSDLVVESLDGAAGKFPFGEEPIEDEWLVGAEYAGDLLHGFDAAAHRALTLGVQEVPCAVVGAVGPEERTKCQVIYLEMSAPPGWVAVRNSPSRLRRVKYSGLAQFDTWRWV